MYIFCQEFYLLYFILSSFCLYLFEQKYYNIVIKDKPGITGLWQISGRSDVTFDERLKMDLEYNSKKTILNDIIIIIKTFGKVIGKNGAR